MLYLEDYLEMIEHLPAELRDRFTEMREMDLSVQNRVDSLEEKQKTFFANCRRLKTAEREEEYEKIRRDYAKVIEDSSEKIQNAEESYNLVDRYLRKLDQELHKFKMELEADNRGITEILEKRSLEMDAPAAATSKENRHPKKHVPARKNHTIAHPTSSSASSSSSLTMGTTLDRMGGLIASGNKVGDHRKSATFVFSEGLPGLEASMPSPGGSSGGTGLMIPAGPGASGGSGSGGTYPLQHMGAGGNAIAAAASQAIAATQQMVPGRRTSSLKASYEAINLGLQAHEFSIGRELAGAAHAAIAATTSNAASMAGTSSSGDSPVPSKRQKVSKRSSAHVEQSMLDVVNSGGGGGSSGGGGGQSLIDDSLLESVTAGSPSAEDLLGGGASRDGAEEWNYDPSEPRYCVCNQVSYGDMVACDNVDCPYEWFHYPCVGITAPPKGKWYCPTCLARRKSRK